MVNDCKHTLTYKLLPIPNNIATNDKSLQKRNPRYNLPVLNQGGKHAAY